MEDDPRNGAPTTAKTHTNIDLVKDILDGDRRATYDELEKQSGLSRGTLQRIIHKALEEGLCKMGASTADRRTPKSP